MPVVWEKYIYGTVSGAVGGKSWFLSTDPFGTSPKVVKWLQIAKRVGWRRCEDVDFLRRNVDADELVADTGGSIDVAICSRSNCTGKSGAVLQRWNNGVVKCLRRVWDVILVDVSCRWVYPLDFVDEYVFHPYGPVRPGTYIARTGIWGKRTVERELRCITWSWKQLRCRGCLHCCKEHYG